MAPVHFAARYGTDRVTTENLVSTLMNSMNNPLQQDKFGNTVVHHAILNGDPEVRRALTILVVHLEITVGLVIKTKFKWKDLRKTTNHQKHDGLHLASEKGYGEVIEILMREGKAEAKYQNKQNMNALHIAVKEKKPECVDMILKLISEQKDSYKDLTKILNEEDKKGNTPLCIGIEKKYDDIVHLLLEKQKEVGFQKKEGLLNFCAKHGNIEIMADLYGHFKLADNEEINVDYPLHFAIEANNREIVQLLIEIGADINRNIGGKVSLEVAIEKGHSEIVDILLVHKQLDWQKFSLKKNVRQINLLHYAVRSGKSIVIEDLLKFLMKKNNNLCTKMLTGKDHEEGNTPLHFACNSPSFLKEEIESFVEYYRRQDVRLHELKNDNGHTPLHLASISGNIEFVKALCVMQTEGGKSDMDMELIEVTDIDDNKAMHVAAKYKQPDVLDFLLRCSQDHKPTNSYGKTPLHCASESGTVECVEKILSLVDEKNRKCGSKKIVNVDNKDSQGNTSLHLASRNGFDKIVKRLLDSGGDVMIIDQKGRNALQLAIEKEQEKVVETIIESKSWMKSLRASYTIHRGFQHVLDTPMRLLIRNLPEMAERVLDRCREVSINAKDQKEITNYNFEYLEDTFRYKLKEEDDKKLYKHVDNLKETIDFNEEDIEEDGDFAAPYTYYGDIFVSNHPLMVINNYKQQNLLQHDVTSTLINRKWNHFGKWFYYFNFLFYSCFLATLTTYVLSSQPYNPQMYPNLYQCSPYFSDHQFDNKNQTYLFPEEVFQGSRDTLNYGSRTILVVLTFIRFLSIVIGHEFKIVWETTVKVCFILKEFCLLLVSPFLSKKKKKTQEEKEAIKIEVPSQNLFYFFLKQEWALIFDLAVYIQALVIAFNETYVIETPEHPQLRTYLRSCFQWQVSAACVTLAWINLLVYMRQMSLVGKYIIILNDIIYTFVTFVVIFIIFVIGFTFGFYLLLHTQGSFETISTAFMKTLIMMSGEFDYGDIFFPDGEASAPFPTITYILFIVFFILLALILLNLLVGLSVSDVAIFVEVADLKKMSMRLKFVLNMEHFYRQWSRLFAHRKLPLFIKKILQILGKIFPAVRRITTWKKESDLNGDNHIGKMWKQVIADNVQEEKKNDLVELKHKTELIEERIEQIEKDIIKTMKQLKEINFEARKNDKERKIEIQETLALIKAMEEKGEVEKEKRKKEAQETKELIISLKENRENDKKETLALIKAMEERREREKEEIKKEAQETQALIRYLEKKRQNEKKEGKKQSKADGKKMKNIEDNVGEILDLLRRRRSELDDDEFRRTTENDQNQNTETRNLPSSHYILI
eukprot:GFUD01037707.1.p1 GENE.GFUD01037707.1~~GFUD01037707.1.p1  ORF type:complete len:1460 (+),score=369.86 GFUD01037707.1:404-4381(+)